MKGKERYMDWEQVVALTRSLSQDATEAFWDEIVVLVDPRNDTVPAWAVKQALQFAKNCWSGSEGQGVLEYVAILALVAIVIFVLVTWLLGDGGTLETLKSTIAMFP